MCDNSKKISAIDDTLIKDDVADITAHFLFRLNTANSYIYLIYLLWQPLSAWLGKTARATPKFDCAINFDPKHRKW